MAAPSSRHHSRTASATNNNLDLHPTHSSNSTAISSTDTTPIHTPRKEPSSPRLSHRSLLADSGRSSQRASRTLSISGAALTELLMQQHGARINGADDQFIGRDWKAIQVHEIIDPAETRFVELDTSIEETTKLLIRSGAPNLVLVRESRKTKTAIDTFGYDELMAYLLLVLGITQPDELAAELAHRARAGETLPLRLVLDYLGRRDVPTLIPHTANLMQAMEVLGSGLHRVLVCREGTSEAVGVLSQLRLVRFLWENHHNFAATEHLYSRALGELGLGAKVVVAISGDKPLSNALRLMHDEGITSLPVLDAQHNVVGNISHVDTRLLTDTSAIPLLDNTCIHFISVILSERGMQDGKDAYPVFYVTPFSTLAHAVAKLCATRSHRMWIVDAPSPSTSVPPSPGVGMFHVPPFSIMTSQGSNPTPPRSAEHALGPMSAHPGTSINPGMNSVSAGQLPGAALSGRLSGVVSLTDVLNCLAKASGLSPGDPDENRRRRRGSSSSSQRMNPDAIRASGDFTAMASELISFRGERSASRSSNASRK